MRRSHAWLALTVSALTCALLALTSPARRALPAERADDARDSLDAPAQAATQQAAADETRERSRTAGANDPATRAGDEPAAANDDGSQSNRASSQPSDEPAAANDDGLQSKRASSQPSDEPAAANDDGSQSKRASSQPSDDGTRRAGSRTPPAWLTLAPARTRTTHSTLPAGHSAPPILAPAPLRLLANAYGASDFTTPSQPARGPGAALWLRHCSLLL